MVLVLLIRKTALVVLMLNKVRFGVLKCWPLVIICAGCIFYFSSLPGTSIPQLFSFQENLFHFFIFFILGLFFSRALQNTFLGVSGRNIIIFTFIFTLFYGISDEFHQYFVPYRDVSILDVSIDGLGGLFGGLFYIWLK